MRVENKLFIPSLGILTTIIIIIITNLNTLQSTVDVIYESCISSFGWLFLLANIGCLIFSFWLMFGRYKDIRLGGDDCKPIFSTLSWAGMMFTTSCGAWLIVYGFLEPIYCSSQNIFLIGEDISKVYEYGQMYAHFHWGPNAWCIYIPISIAIGYVLYNRKGKSSTVSTSIIAIIGRKKYGKILSIIVDIIAICATVIAPVISIGTGMPLLTSLVQNIFGISGVYQTTIQIIILIIWISIFGTSVYMGLNKGIKYLSNINILMAFIFMAIFFVIVGIITVFSSEVNNIGLVAQNFIRLSTYTDPYGAGGFVNGWTFSYWACYFVYMPLMGVFNAKISKGRTFRQIVFGQLVLCTLGCWIAMGTFGNFAIKAQLNGIVDISNFLQSGNEAGAIIALLDVLPASKLFMIILLVILFIFLATTMDSSAFVAAEMTVVQKGEEALAPRWLRITWAIIAAIIAFILVQVGGAKAVRSLCYITGLPLAIIVFIIIASVHKMLNEDHYRKIEQPFLTEDKVGKIGKNKFYK